jgi:RNA polymerase sigma-70 factor, ECF subfamily
MTSLDVFNEHRSLLFGIAYRMLGSRSDAEDIVQEAYIRWQNASVDEVKSPKSYLSTIVTRLAIDHLRSARVQREEYVGPWLPEPILTGEQSDPMTMSELSESLSFAFLVLLETLSETERAAFLLHEVFDYEYSDISQMIGKSEAACRQLVHRAKDRVSMRPRRFEPSTEISRQIAGQFLEAAQNGNIDRLMSMLAPDVRLVADGGGKVAAAKKPVEGAEAVARLIDGLMKKFVPAGATLGVTEANGQTALIISVGDTVISMSVLEIKEGLIQTIYSIANPEKLAGVRRDAPARKSS